MRANGTFRATAVSPGVDESENSVVLDRPAVDRQRVCPGAGQEQAQLPLRALLREQEAVLDLHVSGREGVDLHAVGSDLADFSLMWSCVAGAPWRTSAVTICRASNRFAASGSCEGR
jgi:hypothetical protein